MSKRALVSVIVPVYNVAEYLERCIESILIQTYTNIELILVDDGSTDNSGLICDQWEEKDRRVKVVHKENGGLSDARNVGIECSTGDYLVFIDSDDYIEKDMILLLCNEMEKGYDLAICNYQKVNDEKQLVENIYAVKEKCIGEEEFWNRYFYENATYYAVACNKMYKRCQFEQVRYEQGRLHEDEFILHKIIEQCNRIMCLSYVGYNYYQRSGSIMNKRKIKSYFDTTDVAMERVIWFRSRKKEHYMHKSFKMGMLSLVEVKRQKLNEKETEIWKKKKKQMCSLIQEHVKYKKVKEARLKIEIFMFKNMFPIYQLLGVIRLRMLEHVTGR